VKLTLRLLLVAVVLGFLSGCSSKVADLPVFDRYHMTTLKFSTSSDIIGIIREGETEVLSQSESVVASWDQDEGKGTLWFNMVAFDEEEFTAVRKYAFFVDERQHSWWRPGIFVDATMLRFDGEYVFDAETLEEPYANDNVKKIAILRAALNKFSSDAMQLSGDSQILRASAMMIKQSVNTVLTKLDGSPGIAVRLDELSGLGFDHMLLNKSRIRMLIEGDVVKIKVKCGNPWFKWEPFEEHPDVINM
jgi:hypothetical protein